MELQEHQTEAVDAPAPAETPTPTVRHSVLLHNTVTLERTPEEKAWLEDVGSLPPIKRGEAVHARSVIHKFAMKLSNTNNAELQRLQDLVTTLGQFYQRTPSHAHERIGLIGQFGYHCAFAIGVGEPKSREAYRASNRGVDPIVELEHALATVRKPFDVMAPIQTRKAAIG